MDTAALGTNWPLVVIAALLSGGGMGAILSFIIQWRTQSATSKVQGAAQVIDGFDKFTQQLLAQIDMNNKEIARLQGCLVELDAKYDALSKQYDTDRAAWAAERAGLEQRIEDLEGENRRLKEQFAGLTSTRRK